MDDEEKDELSGVKLKEEKMVFCWVWAMKNHEILLGFPRAVRREDTGPDFYGGKNDHNFHNIIIIYIIIVIILSRWLWEGGSRNKGSSPLCNNKVIKIILFIAHRNDERTIWEQFKSKVGGGPAPLPYNHKFHSISHICFCVHQSTYNTTCNIHCRAMDSIISKGLSWYFSIPFPVNSLQIYSIIFMCESQDRMV